MAEQPLAERGPPITLAAQGFDRARPTSPVGGRHIRRTIQQLGLLQIGLRQRGVPAHYQLLYSRLGPYVRSHLDDWCTRARVQPSNGRMRRPSCDGDVAAVVRHRMEKHRVRPYPFKSFMEQNAAMSAGCSKRCGHAVR